MSTIVVVNGSYTWGPHFLGHRLIQTSLERSRWMLERGALWIVDRHGTHKPDAILWRLGAVEPSPMHRACLEMIRLSGVPCVNTADTLLRGYDRLSMLYEMRCAGLPVIPFECFAGDGALNLLCPTLPAVLKRGNLHGGAGKARACDEEQWNELTGLISLKHDYATAEPYVPYSRDVRCLAVGDEMWAMERKSDTWKANVNTTMHQLIDPPSPLKIWTQQAMRHLGADVLGLDYLETAQGEWWLLESNDIPGMFGFPERVPQAVAQRLLEHMQRLD